MITAVMLSWKRPGNLPRIVESWQQVPEITERIIWNNNPDVKLADLGATVISASQDLGLYSRFAAGGLARNGAVLMQDDDLLLPPATIRRLLSEWQRDPDILHGIFGRKARPDGSYDPRNVLARGGQSRDVLLVLTRALVFRREYCGDFLGDVRTHFDPIQSSSRPYGNGEDILLNFLARKRTGRLNRIHPVPWKELPGPHAIYKRGGHYHHRTQLLRACEAWLRDPCTCRDRTPRSALEHEVDCPIRLTFLPRPEANSDAESG
jgi:hypothetical protein